MLSYPSKRQASTTRIFDRAGFDKVVIPIQTTGFYNEKTYHVGPFRVVIPIQTTGFYNLSSVTA